MRISFFSRIIQYQYTSIPCGISMVVFLFFGLNVMGQTAGNGKMVFGRVVTKSGKPVSAASISVKGSYDGGNSDSTGYFSFETSEQSNFLLEISAIGYRTAVWQPSAVQLLKDSIAVGLVVMVSVEEELNTVVITAGSFAAGDQKRGTVLSSLDILTTASANGDVTGAIQTLPGAQQVGETEGLFVRGGAGNETKIFIDGMLVNNFFFSSVPNIAQRGRFSPFLFKGTVFSSGGYSAQYGQALSAALLLESVDLPEKSSADINLSVVGLSAGFQNLAKNKKSSWGIQASHTNLAPYFGVIPQRPDYDQPPALTGIEANARFKTKSGGMIKLFGYYNYSVVGLNTTNIDTAGWKNGFSVRNANVYLNATWKEFLDNGWSFETGLSFGYNDDKIKNKLLDETGESKDGSSVPWVQNQPFAVEQFSAKWHLRFLSQKKWNNQSKLISGFEWFQGEDTRFFSNRFVSSFRNELSDHLIAGFLEWEKILAGRLAIKPGWRTEYHSLTRTFSAAPRLAAAYKTGKKSQVSAAYGMFFQKQDVQFLFQRPSLDAAQSNHFILNYQYNPQQRLLRVEAFYKNYNRLITTLNDTSTNGKGYATGAEVFFRDKKSIKGIDYWVSYSFLNTERIFLNYPVKAQPSFAANHTASLVIKKFIAPLKTNLNTSYSFATGRPFFNPDLPQSSFHQDRTKAFHNVGLALNYLPSLGQKSGIFTIWVLSITNVLGSEPEFGFNYSNRRTNADGSRFRQAIGLPAKRFLYFGVFINFGTDRRDEIMNNQL